MAGRVEEMAAAVSCVGQTIFAPILGLLCAGLAYGCFAGYSFASKLTRKPTCVTVASAEDSATLRYVDNVTVNTFKENDSTRYKVSFPFQDDLICDGSQDSTKQFPYSHSTNKFECQQNRWNTCTLQVDDDHASSWEESHTASCNGLAGTNRKVYENIDPFNLEPLLSSTDSASIAMVVLAGFGVLMATLAVWNLLRSVLIPWNCNYRLPEEIPKDDSTGEQRATWKEFHEAWQSAFLADKAEEVVNAVTGTAAASDNQVVSAVGDVAGKFYAFRAFYKTVRSDYLLYKCGAAEPSSRGMGGFLLWYAITPAVLFGGLAVALAVWLVTTATGVKAEECSVGREPAQGLGAWLDTPLIPSMEHDGRQDGMARWIVIAIGLLCAVSLLHNLYKVILFGRWRTAVGLSFFDWPKMVL